MSVKPLVVAFANLFVVSRAAHAELTVKVVPQPTLQGNEHPQWPGPVDQSGNTSVANGVVDAIKHASTTCCGYYATAGDARSETAYFERSRDLGQSFTFEGKRVRTLDHITVRLGFGSNVVRPGMWDQEVGLQIFAVRGECKVDLNGSTTHAKHGFPHTPPTAIPPKRDDFCVGETYKPLITVRGARFPLPSQFGCNSPAPAPGDACLKGKYLRFDVGGRDEVKLRPNRRYAFVVMIAEPGPSRGFALANAYEGSYTGGHGIRREGDGRFPPPSADPSLTVTHPANGVARAAGSLGVWSARTSQSPGTNGYPDVDTWRDLEFYVATRP